MPELFIEKAKLARTQVPRRLPRAPEWWGRKHLIESLLPRFQLCSLGMNQWTGTNFMLRSMLPPSRFSFHPKQISKPSENFAI